MCVSCCRTTCTGRELRYMPQPSLPTPSFPPWAPLALPVPHPPTCCDGLQRERHHFVLLHQVHVLAFFGFGHNFQPPQPRLLGGENEVDVPYRSRGKGKGGFASPSACSDRWQPSILTASCPKPARCRVLCQTSGLAYAPCPLWLGHHVTASHGNWRAVLILTAGSPRDGLWNISCVTGAQLQSSISRA